jgi:hypothetical protein
MYFDRELAAWVLMGVMIGLALGYIIGFYIPIPGVTHLKTVTTTVINNTTITVPINVTRTVTYTTTVNGKVVTMTTTIIMPTTTTVVSNTTITRIIIVPTTTTVNHTTTVTSTSVTTIPPYTLTVTTTIVENASLFPPLNMSDPGSILNYIKDDFGLGMMGIANLSLPLGYCIGTMWILPNASVVWLGAWFIPQNIAQKMMSNYAAVYTFPKTGIKEYVPYVTPDLVVLNYLGNSYYGLGAGSYLININYPGNGYIVGLYGSNIVGSLPPWGLTVSPGIYQLLNNGTYIMAIVNESYVPPTLMQLVLNPPGLCLIQVIRVKPSTPDSYILNMTFWGAQYVAWAISEAVWGKPAPCYRPWEWTYGFWVYRINITEPIGSTWDYYCGPPKGIWLPMKP